MPDDLEPLAPAGPAQPTRLENAAIGVAIAGGAATSAVGLVAVGGLAVAGYKFFKRRLRR